MEVKLNLAFAGQSNNICVSNLLATFVRVYYDAECLVGTTISHTSPPYTSPPYTSPPWTAPPNTNPPCDCPTGYDPVCVCRIPGGCDTYYNFCTFARQLETGGEDLTSFAFVVINWTFSTSFSQISRVCRLLRLVYFFNANQPVHTYHWDNLHDWMPDHRRTSLCLSGPWRLRRIRQSVSLRTRFIRRKWVLNLDFRTSICVERLIQRQKSLASMPVIVFTWYEFARAFQKRMNSCLVVHARAQAHRLQLTQRHLQQRLLVIVRQNTLRSALAAIRAIATITTITVSLERR